MSSNTYYIEHDGKKLTTFKQLKNWYLKFIEREKKQDPNFNERRFAEMERTVVFTVIYNLNPTDPNASVFKKTLFKYLLDVIYNSLKAPMYPIRLPQDIYMEYLSCFNTLCDNIPEHQLQKQFIESEIERHERINSDWAKQLSVNDPIFNHVYDAIQMFLHHLKLKITNYEHTTAASAHEKIVAQYYFSQCGLPLYDNTIMLPEQLENRLIMECVAYKHALSDNWQSLVQDNDYFVKFIKGTLLREFKESIFERIKPLNNFEITKIFTLSLEDFKIFKPELREKQFIKKYSDAYWHPNYMDKVIASEEHTAKYLISVLSKYYHLFVKATEQAFLDHQSNMYGLTHIPPIPENKLPSIKLTPMQQEFILKKRPFNEPAIFQDLLDEAMENDLIEYIDAPEESVLNNEYKDNFKKWICKKIKQSDISSDLFRTYFVYSNFEQFILEINQPDYDNTPFRSPYVLPFDTVFNDALYYELIVPENAAQKAASYSYYDFAFTEWLRSNLNIKTEEEYNKQCTLENFKKLLKEEGEKQEAARQKYEQEKLKHQMDIRNIKPKDIKVDNDSDNSNGVDSPKTFETIMSKEKQDYFLKLLEDFNITNNGKSTISKKGFWKIRAIVDVCMAQNILPQLSIHPLCLIIANKIELPLKAVLKTDANDYEKFCTQLRNYIKANPIP